MNKFLRTLLLTIFICTFLVGVIGLIIPFDFEKFSYDNPTSNNNGYTYKISFDIDNDSDKEYKNVIVKINYTTKQNFISYQNHEIEVTTDLKEDDNEIFFSHSSNDITSSFSKINSVKLTFEDGRSFQIYSKSGLVAGINWTFTCLCIVGFFGTAIVSAISLFRKKEYEFKERDTRSFNEKIRSAFMPVADTINTLKKTYEESKRNIENSSNNKTEEIKPKKITCQYCKGKYSSTDDKCPHCGAPPEPCD